MTKLNQDADAAQAGIAHIGATQRLKMILDMLASQAKEHGPGERQASDNHILDEATDQARGAADSPRGPTATLGQLIDALDERAYGVMLLLLALPCCLPFLYGIPQIVALPMLALSAQLAFGREAPWLPRRLAKRDFDITSMQSAVGRAERYLGWVERFSHARFRSISNGVGARIVGALLLIPCASILVPLPLTNTTPGIGVAITAVGLIERDGLLIILGLLLGLIWVFLLLFLGGEAISYAKDWVLALF